MKKTASNVDGFIVRSPRQAKVSLDSLDNKYRVKVNKKSRQTENSGFEDDLVSNLEDLPGYGELSDDDLAEEPKVSDKKVQKVLRKAEKKARKGKKSRRKLKVVLIILSVLALLVVGVFVGMKYLWPEDTIDGNWWEVLWGQELRQDKNGFSNILIFGTSPDDYDGGLLADTVMVLSINQTSKDIFMVSLPRDLWVKHDCPNKLLNTTAGKLNETYLCALTSIENEEAEADKAAAEFRSKAGEITGLDVQYHVHMSWEGLEQIVDAVGGIEIEISSSDSRGIYDVQTGMKYANGLVHMDGEQALTFARARGSAGGYGLEGSNFSREAHQQQIIKAVQEQALSSGTLSNPATLVSLIQALGSSVRTNFNASELQALARLGKEINTENIVSLPLVDAERNFYLVKNDNINGASVVVPVAGLFNYSQIQAYLRENMSSDPVVKEKAVIDALNGSGVVGLAGGKADELEKQGFLIGEISNAPAGQYAAVEIYQLNSTKTATAEALGKLYGVEIKTTSLAGYTTTADFVIIYGT